MKESNLSINAEMIVQATLKNDAESCKLALKSAIATIARSAPQKRGNDLAINALEEAIYHLVIDRNQHMNNGSAAE